MSLYLTIVLDHGRRGAMEEIAISKFKATCLAVLERVRKTGEPVRITRFGVPVAEIQPPQIEQPAERPLGCLEGELEIVGDIVGPIGAWDEHASIREWEELNPMRNLSPAFAEPPQPRLKRSRKAAR